MHSELQFHAQRIFNLKPFWMFHQNGRNGYNTTLFYAISETWRRSTVAVWKSNFINTAFTNIVLRKFCTWNMIHMIMLSWNWDICTRKKCFSFSAVPYIPIFHTHYALLIYDCWISLHFLCCGVLAHLGFLDQLQTRRLKNEKIFCFPHGILCL